MTRQQQRVWLGVGIVAAIFIAMHPRCNQACKNLIGTIVSTGFKRFG